VHESVESYFQSFLIDTTNVQQVFGIKKYFGSFFERVAKYKFLFFSGSIILTHIGFIHKKESGFIHERKKIKHNLIFPNSLTSLEQYPNKTTKFVSNFKK